MRPDNNEIESPSLLRSIFYRTARSAKIAHTKFHRTRLGMLIPALLAGSMLAACTYVPFDGPRKDSTFMADPAARLDLGLDDLDPGTGIFLPLADGNDALGARLRLIEQARSSIDFKTFLIKPDIAGSLFGVALFKAAERGVRVRLLVDDVFTPAKDSGLAAFDAHPNIEVRIFNPLSRNSITAVNYMLDFGRVNRRMHNKALIVDGYGAIIGGRNIADEYYQIKTSSEFADFDLFLAGSVVGDLGSAFDMYWADQWAVPVSNLYEGATDDEIRAAIAEFDATAQSEEAKIYQRAVDSTYLSDLREGRIKPDYGTAVAVVDPPEKLRERQGGESQTTARELMGAMQRAKSDVVLITPYFVPEEYGVEFFTELEKKGIRVRVVTNSLAATNHPYVHGGYTPYRRALLDAGVELYEVRADAAQHLGLYQ